MQTFHAFQRTDDHAKQVPLVFVLMSGRKKKDYRKVTCQITVCTLRCKADQAACLVPSQGTSLFHVIFT